MRTPLMQLVEDAVTRAAAEEPRTTRRALLHRAGAGALGLSALGRLTPAARAAADPRIVVVGAGLAGLTCAYRLKQAGYVAQVYEAADRVGGRRVAIGACPHLAGLPGDGLLGGGRLRHGAGT